MGEPEAVTDTEQSGEPCVIGIDVGGTKALGLVMNGRGEVIERYKWPTPKGAPAVTDTLVDLTRDLQASIGPTYTVRGVGVGMAGLIDRHGCLRRAPNLVNVDEFAVRDSLQPRLELPVVVDNDANCAARAELHSGVAVGVAHGVLVTLGTGIGGALIVDARVYRGAVGMAGEPGHMLVDPAGPKCVCGLYGCWERYASGAGLAYLGRLAADEGTLAGVVGSVGGDPASLRGEDIIRGARLGDPEAAAVVDRYAWWVAAGMANCAAISDPELIIVGGGLVRDWDLFGPQVRSYLEERLLAAAHRPRIRVEPAAAGEAAGALGAALLAAEETGVRRPGDSG